MVLARHWAEGGKGAEELAHEVVRLADTGENNFHYAYDARPCLRLALGHARFPLP